jgi:hypothetical protein
MQGILTSGGVTSVQIGDWRLFPFHWLNRYRTVTKSITEPAQALIPSNQAVFVLHLSCGEISETASDIINALAEAGQNFQVFFCLDFFFAKKKCKCGLFSKCRKFSNTYIIFLKCKKIKTTFYFWIDDNITYIRNSLGS